MRELTHAVIAACLMLAGALLGQALTPSVKLSQQIGEPNFLAMVPAQLGDWAARDEVDLGAILDPQSRQPNGRRLNSQVMKRIYRHADGRELMLLIAYAPSLGRVLHAYRPEALYPAQGMAVLRRWTDGLTTPEGPLVIHRMLAARDASHREAVSYWSLIGTDATANSWHSHWLHIDYASRNLAPDGLILRVSSPYQTSAEAALASQNNFLLAFASHVRPDIRSRLTGLPPVNAGTPVRGDQH
ncbi:MAG: EpsI family protein [Pseudomonadota bacterium]|jgi:EpsI family protein